MKATGALEEFERFLRGVGDVQVRVAHECAG